MIKLRRMRWEGTSVHKVSVGKSEGKTPYRHRWNNTIKMDLKEIGCSPA
jgi:hypothetical protein